MPRSRRAVALVCALAFLVGACSDDGDDGDATGATDTSDTTEAVSDGSPDASCATFTAELTAAGQAIFQGLQGNPGDELDHALEYLEGVTDSMPEGIREDVRLYTEAYRRAVTAFAVLDSTDPGSLSPDQQAEIQAAIDNFSTPEVADASANLAAFVQDGCPDDQATQ